MVRMGQSGSVCQWLVATFLLAACQADTTPALESAADAALPVITVTLGDESLPAGCRPGSVAERLVQFFDAINRGDQERLREFFGLGFQWYSMSEGDPAHGGRLFAAYTVGDLLAYFEERHQHGERLALREVRVGPVRLNQAGTRQYVDIQYMLARSADDLVEGPDHAGHGKGAFHCEDQTLFVWSAGTAAATGASPGRSLCPTPLADAPTGSVIACAALQEAKGSE